MTKSPRRKPSKQDILAEVLGRISPAGVEPSAAGIELVETGPAKRLVDALGVPFLSSAEYQQIPPAARRVASEVASISASVAEEIRSEVLATAMPLQFGDLEVLQHIGEAGPQADEIVGIVPRAWVLDFVTIDMGFVERQEIQLRPTVLVATPSSIHWTVPAGDSERWRSLPIDGVEGESVPEWSELFGRGPFASFSHEDLGLAAEEGDAALFDIFRLEDQVLASTAYAIEGIAPDQISIGTTREMSEAYGEAEVMAAADLVNSRIEASLTGLRENAKVSSAFVDDLFALAPGLLPFLLSGGFNAFLPLGLDPQGRGGFRHSNVVIHAAGLQKQSPDFQPRVDPAGEPMRSLCGRRGATLPLFVEPTGSGAGSHMALMLESLRAARHRLGAPASDEAGRGSERVRVAVNGSGEIGLASRPASPGGSGSGPDDDRKARREELEKSISVTATADDDASRLAAIEAYLEGHPGNAEAHLARARILRRLDADPALTRAAAEEAVRLDPSPAKYWTLAIAHHDSGDAEGRDRAIRAGRSLWPPSEELAYLWERSSCIDALVFRAEESLEVSDDELPELQQVFLRALRLTPESKGEDLDLRLIDLRISRRLGATMNWFSAICQDILRQYPHEGSLPEVWFVYLWARKQMDEDLDEAVLAAAKKHLGAGEIEALKHYLEASEIEALVAG